MMTYPINLLLKGKRCLIVGGGKVALRKLKTLLAAEAEVIVVSPVISKTIRQAANAGNIELRERKYDARDLDGVTLLFLATGDSSLNQTILKAAQKRGILACSVDSNWKYGSFITPAKVDCKNITIAVSSHGIACRKTKLIKDNLARHLDAIENTELLVLGTDHNRLGINQREHIHLSGDKLNAAGRRIMTLWGIQEFILLNTCNRMELIATGQAEATTLDMLKMILKLEDLEADNFYIKTGFDAFSHLCLVVAGLCSQTPGENHIAAQFKAACEQANINNWSDRLLSAISDHVLHIARHIRNEAFGALKVYEIEEQTLAFLRGKFPELKGKRILLAGAGSVGSAIKQLLEREGCLIDWLYNSREPVVKDKTVTPLPLSKLQKTLPLADIVITALSVKQPVITSEMLNSIKAGAEVVDLGMPRNIASGPVNGNGKFNITDMEGLKYCQRNNHRGLAEALAHARRIIDEHGDIYEQFKKSFIDGRQGQ